MKNLFDTSSPTARRKLAWLLLAVLLIGSSAVSGVKNIGKAPNSFGSFGAMEPERFTEKVVEKGEGSNKIVVLNVEGVLADMPEEELFSASGVVPIRQLSRQIDQAKEDKDVKTLLVVVNSPGGTVTASQTLHEKLIEAKQAGKKIVVLMREVAASGGYYIASAADKIIANPSTLTGSIGVIMQTANLEELYKKVGYKPITFKAGNLKDMGSDSRAITDEEQNLIQGILNEEHNRFMQVVADGRKMDMNKVKQLADGRIYTGDQAKTNGLVDELGNMPKAISVSKEVAGIDKAQVVEYTSSLDFVGDLFGGFLSGGPVNRFFAKLESTTPAQSSGLMYLWQP